MNDFFLDDVLGILGFTSPFWTSEIIISSYTFEIVAGEKEKGTCNNLQLSQRSLWSRAWWYLFPCCCRSSRSKPYAKNHVRKETRDKNKTNRKREWSPLPTLLNDGKHVKLRFKKKRICNFPCFQSFLDGLWDSQTTKAIRLGASRLYLQVIIPGSGWNWKFRDFFRKNDRPVFLTHLWNVDVLM